MCDPPYELSAKRDLAGHTYHRVWNTGARGGPAVVFLLVRGGGQYL